MKKESFRRTKDNKAVIAIGIVGLLLLVSINAMSVTFTQVNTPTETSNNLVTYIHDSNGNYWDVTGANIQLAINTMGDNYGTIWIGSDVTITSELNLNYTGTTLDFCGNQVTLGADVTWLNVSCVNGSGRNGVKYSTVQNVNVVSYNGQTAPMLLLYLPYDAGWSERVYFNLFQNIRLINVNSASRNYEAIKLHIDRNDDANSDKAAFYNNVFQNIFIYAPEVGISLECGDTDLWGNANTFRDFLVERYETVIEFNVHASATNGFNNNLFDNIKSQTRTYSLYGVKAISGEGNKFTNILMFDWGEALSPVYEYEISSDATLTTLEIDYIYNIDTSIYDGGYLSSITVDTREFDYDADYDYKFSINDSDYYFVRQGKNGGYATGGSLDADTDFEALMLSILDEDDIVVRLDNGTFIPDQKIGVTGKNITIEGRDDHTTIIKGVAGTQYASGFFQMIDSGVDNITFRNIVFDGADVSDSSVGLYFGFNEALHGLTVENCIFVNWNIGTSRGIFVSPNTNDVITNVKIINCEFFNCDYGVTLEGDADPSLVQYADVSHNYFKECQFSIFCSYVRNSTFSNNRIISAVASSDGITLGNTFDAIVDGNTVIVADDGIIESGTTDYNMIYGNILRHSGDPLTTVGTNTNATLNLI